MIDHVSCFVCTGGAVALRRTCTLVALGFKRTYRVAGQLHQPSHLICVLFKGAETMQSVLELVYRLSGLIRRTARWLGVQSGAAKNGGAITPEISGVGSIAIFLGMSGGCMTSHNWGNFEQHIEIENRQNWLPFCGFESVLRAAKPYVFTKLTSQTLKAFFWQATSFAVLLELLTVEVETPPAASASMFQSTS